MCLQLSDVEVAQPRRQSILVDTCRVHRLGILGDYLEFCLNFDSDDVCVFVTLPHGPPRVPTSDVDLWCDNDNDTLKRDCPSNVSNLAVWTCVAWVCVVEGIGGGHDPMKKNRLRGEAYLGSKLCGFGTVKKTIFRDTRGSGEKNTQACAVYTFMN